MLCYAKKSAKYNLLNLLTLYRGNFPKFIPKSAGLHCLLSLLFLAQDFMSSKLCCVNIFFLDLEYSSFLMGLKYNILFWPLVTLSTLGIRSGLCSILPEFHLQSPTLWFLEIWWSVFLALVSPHDSRFLSPPSGSSRFTIRHRLFLLLSGTACSLPIGWWTASSRASTSWTNRLWSSHLIRCQ